MPFDSIDSPLRAGFKPASETDGTTIRRIAAVGAITGKDGEMIAKDAEICRQALIHLGEAGVPLSPDAEIVPWNIAQPPYRDFLEGDEPVDLAIICYVFHTHPLLAPQFIKAANGQDDNPAPFFGDPADDRYRSLSSRELEPDCWGEALRRHGVKLVACYGNPMRDLNTDQFCTDGYSVVLASDEGFGVPQRDQISTPAPFGFVAEKSWQEKAKGAFSDTLLGRRLGGESQPCPGLAFARFLL